MRHNIGATGLAPAAFSDMIGGMGGDVELTFAMATQSSASMRVQSMLLPYDDRFENRWVEQGDHTYLVIQVPEGGVDEFIDDVHACHPTVSQVGHETVDA